MIPGILFLLSGLYLQSGHIWSPNWSDGHNRTLSPLDSDPFEKPANVEFSGDGQAYISGHGVMSLTGNAPRYRVLENFHNVIVTLYMKRVNEAHQIDSAGLVIGARSKHYTDYTCGADTYYAQLTNDGRVSFEKELFHGTGEDAFYPDVTDNSAQIYAFDDGIPKSWVGLRFIVQSASNNTAVLLQLYLDKQDNGQWEKVLEYTDKGDWPVKPGFKNIQKKCDGYYTKNKIITEPGFIFIRNDGLGRADYKGFSIRELI
jgi:hypothetical protein